MVIGYRTTSPAVSSRIVAVPAKPAGALATDSLAIRALEALAESRGEASILTDAEGYIVGVNQLVPSMLGWPANVIVGHRCRQFIRCLDGTALGQFRAGCECGRVIGSGETAQRIIQTSHRGRLTMNGRSIPILDRESRCIGNLCTFSSQSEDGLLDHSSAEFLSNVSHELRAPLSSLASSIELLSSNYRTMPKARLGVLLRVIHNSTLQLHSLVENLLSASSIQSGSFHIQPVPSRMTDIVDDAAAFVQPLLDKKRQRLRREVPEALPTIMVDARRVTQVVVNLLSNASKYGPHDDEIALSVAQHGRQIIITVRENGPGIAPEDQDRIFERFYRSRRDGLEPRGVGLGLALVKSIVAAHGGKVGVQSALGAGSTFWLTLPVVYPTNGHRSDEEPHSEGARS